MLDKWFKIRVSAEELAFLNSQASKAGTSLTAHARQKLGLEEPRSTAPVASSRRWICLTCNSANFSTSCSRCGSNRP